MLSGARILVAEDESFIALDLADHLEGFGAQVIGPAATVREGLRLSAAERFDSALLDFNLADGEVTPLLEILAARQVPVVVYSGRGLPEELLRKHPSVTVLSKPAPMHLIVGAIAAARERQGVAASSPATTEPAQSQVPYSGTRALGTQSWLGESLARAAAVKRRG